MDSRLHGDYKRQMIRFFLSLLTISLMPTLAYAKIGKELSYDLEENIKMPAQIEADSLDYYSNEKIVIAAGNVEIIQGAIKLFADHVVYNQGKNTVFATGNIKLQEADGNVVQAEKIELKDDLKQGIIEQLEIKFADNSRMWAENATRKNESVAIARKLRYTPCKICSNGKSTRPLWQLRADKAKIDEIEEKVSYNNAYFDVLGVPVLYTPYLSHPTPNAKRKSGILVPDYSNDNIFGTRVRIPYYFNMAPNMDATIAPVYTSEEGVILEGEFRHMLNSGEYEFFATVTKPTKRDINGSAIEGNEVRGHIEGLGNFDLSDKWSWGFNVKRSSDDTYLERYNYSYEDTLTSKVYSTAIDQRNYVYAEAISFQGLQLNDDPGTTPLILPSVKMHYETGPRSNGSNFTYDANLLSLYRNEGIRSNRLSMQGGWHIPYVTNNGHIFELSSSLRADAYYVDNIDSSVLVASEVEDDFTFRFTPELQLRWKYPLIKNTKNSNIYLEPIANIILSPFENNPNSIPNEDSQDIEFSDENLFDANHFTGYDRIETGPRMNYGVRGRVDYDKYGSLDFMLGQIYRTKRNLNFDENSGLRDNFSDFVGRIDYKTEKYFDFSYRYRIDKDDFSLNRNAVTASVDVDPIFLQVDYLSLNDSFDSTIANSANSKREFVIVNSNVDVSENWSVRGNLHHDLKSDEFITTGLGALYNGDCIDLSLNWSREFTQDRDIEPNNTFSFQIGLKNLGY